MPDPLVIQVAQQFKEQLEQRDEAMMRIMARSWLRVHEALNDRLDLLVRAVLDMVNSGERITSSKLYRMEHYQVLLIQLRAEIEAYSTFAEYTIITGQEELAEQGSEDARALLGATYQDAKAIAPTFSRLPREAITLMVGTTTNGSPLRTLLEKAYPDAVEGITKTLVQATALGINPRRTARAMALEILGPAVDRRTKEYLTLSNEAKRSLDQGLNRALVIARTEQNRVYREASRATYIKSGVVRGYRRLAAHQPRTCMACIIADGTFYELSQDFEDHPNGRCTLIPVVKTLKNIEWEFGKQWFLKQSPETQKAMMGIGTYNSWKEGKFELDSLITRKHSDEWGNSLQVTPLKVLLGKE
jgi:hypothetical protein